MCILEFLYRHYFFHSFEIFCDFMWFGNFCLTKHLVTFLGPPQEHHMSWGMRTHAGKSLNRGKVHYHLLCISTSFLWLRAPESWSNFWTKKNCFFHILLTPQSWSTCKNWSTPWGGNSKSPFFGWFYNTFFCSFLYFFCWFQAWNHWKSFKINKKGWKRLKKVVQPAFGCPQHPKAGWNTQQSLV